MGLHNKTTLFLLFILGIMVFFSGCGKKNEEIKLAFDRDYAVIGENLKVKAEGGHEKIDYNWYRNNRSVLSETDTYPVTDEDKEAMLKVVATKRKTGETFQREIYVSSLPVIYISTKDGVGDEDYKSATWEMQGSKEFELNEDNTYEGIIQIKLRGNSTRYRPKAPYKIKLDKKTDLMNLGKSKHWVLLADDIDHTLYRNKLVMDFALNLGLEATSKSEKVVLILDGDYKGVYTLCEHVRVGKNQVNVFDWEELAEDLAEEMEPDVKENYSGEWTETESEYLKRYVCADLGWLSEPYELSYKNNTYKVTDYIEIPQIDGGFLLEADFYANPDSYNSVETNYLQPFYFNTPEKAYTNEELKSYTMKYIQAFEYALHSEDFVYHEKETHYRMSRNGSFNFSTGWKGTETETDFSAPEYDGWKYDDFFDMDSLVNYYIVTEFTKNWDSMKNSLFLYKDNGKKAVIGPAWDYDWAFGNINMYEIDTYFPTGWHTSDINFTREQHYQQYNWYRYLVKDPVFVQKVYERWQEIRYSLIENMIKEGGELDAWHDLMLDAGKKNDKRWKFSYSQYHSVGYEESWENLVTFINTRVSWLDEQFKDYETLYKSLNDTNLQP